MSFHIFLHSCKTHDIYVPQAVSASLNFISCMTFGCKWCRYQWEHAQSIYGWTWNICLLYRWSLVVDSSWWRKLLAVLIWCVSNKQKKDKKADDLLFNFSAVVTYMYVSRVVRTWLFIKLNTRDALRWTLDCVCPSISILLWGICSIWLFEFI